MDINKVIGLNVQMIRNKQNLSLSQLAEKTGLSKAAISQIEKGNANPTINTIWKLASALHVSYSSILEMPDFSAVKVAYKDLVNQSDEKGHYRISCYYPANPERTFELFLLEFDPYATHTTNGHVDSSQEYLIVKKGSLSLTTHGETYVLEEGDALCFNAALKHIYKNLSDDLTQVICLNYYLDKEPVT